MLAPIIFACFVGFVLWLSFYFAGKAKSSEGYFAAGGTVHWAVNGISFAGDYLSAASFLGICALIATKGYDGFLYSIGYLAGWVVALFVVAEPMKRLGKFTFTDALDSKFNSKGIQFAAAISTLVVSICYLIPQMVGAGTLVTPLLGLSHAVGVIMVGTIVIIIVATAGMTSTTYVQFLKGALLIIFSTILVGVLCHRGLTTTPDQGGRVPFYKYAELSATMENGSIVLKDAALGYTVVDSENEKFVAMEKTVKLTKQVLSEKGQWVPVAVKQEGSWTYPVKNKIIQIDDSKNVLGSLLHSEVKPIELGNGLKVVVEKINGRDVYVPYDGNTKTLNGVRYINDEGVLYATIKSWWSKVDNKDGTITLHESQSVTTKADGGVWINGAPSSDANTLMQGGNLEKIKGKTGKEADTGSIGPIDFVAIIGDENTLVRRFGKTLAFADGEDSVVVYYPVFTTGKDVMSPGVKFKGIKSDKWVDRLDFISLMLALFCGTAALPHILIRYYTVPSPACARKSTILAIAAIGFFYILTLFMGLGAMASGTLNLADGNMSAPLLARAFGETLFAVISAIAFATVLGTVSGLIVASSGAVAHDLLDRYCELNMKDSTKVAAGKLAALAIGLIAIILGIIFKGVNVSFLVGWAFAVAASANLPAIIMLLFWKKTTAKGIVASIFVGMISALGIILLSPNMYVQLYHLPKEQALISLNQPGIISITLSFLTLVVVSLMTQADNKKLEEAATQEVATQEKQA